jgi:hypothetical protein
MVVNDNKVLQSVAASLGVEVLYIKNSVRAAIAFALLSLTFSPSSCIYLLYSPEEGSHAILPSSCVERLFNLFVLSLFSTYPPSPHPSHTFLPDHPTRPFHFPLSRRLVSFLPSRCSRCPPTLPPSLSDSPLLPLPTRASVSFITLLVGISLTYLQSRWSSSYSSHPLPPYFPLHPALSTTSSLP